MKTFLSVSSFAAVSFLCSCATNPALVSVKDSHGFARAFADFVTLGQSGDRIALGKLVSPELQEELRLPFVDQIPANWRLGELRLLAAPMHLLPDERLVVVEAIVERSVRPSSPPGFYVMYWIKRDDHWTFLNFPFADANPYLRALHPFANTSIRMIAERQFVEGLRGK